MKISNVENARKLIVELGELKEDLSNLNVVGLNIQVVEVGRRPLNFVNYKINQSLVRESIIAILKERVKVVEKMIEELG